MIIEKKGNRALLFALVFSLGLGACGTGNDDITPNSGATPVQPTNVSVKTGAVSADSWGYTGSSPIQVMAPAQTSVLIKEHTLLVDPFQAVVSGIIDTKISYSSDKTSLTAAAQASVPANAIFVSYLNISMGPVKTTIPQLSVTVDVGVALSGTTVTVYNFDAGIGAWTSAQNAVVNSLGKVTFPVNQLSLWGIFR